MTILLIMPIRPPGSNSAAGDMIHPPRLMPDRINANRALGTMQAEHFPSGSRDVSVQHLIENANLCRIPLILANDAEELLPGAFAGRNSGMKLEDLNPAGSFDSRQFQLEE